MKQLMKLIALMVLLFSINYAGWANSHAGGDPVQEIRAKIIQLIGEPEFSDSKVKKMTSTLHFTINTNQELVVLRVDTDYKFCDQFFKERLNYKKVSNSKMSGRYAMKITLKNGSR